MQPIPANPLPFNPSFLKVTRSDLWCVLADTLRTVEDAPDTPESVGATIRAEQVEGYIRSIYGLA